MRKLFLHVFTSCAMFCFGLGLTTAVKFLASNASPSPSPQKDEQRANVTDLIGDDETQLREIFRDYGPAQTKHDRAFFERVEADNFILFQGDQKLTREQDIKWMESWPKGIVYDFDVESIKVVGDAAVVIGQLHTRYPSGSTASSGFIDICVRKGDSWQILSTTSVE